MSRKRLKARVKQDGSASDEPIWYHPNDPETGKPFEGGVDGRPGVGFKLRHVTPTEYRRVVQEHTSRFVDPETKIWTEKVDNPGVGDEICRRAVVDWWGIEASDGGELPYRIDYVLAVLDIVSRADVQYLSTRALSPVTEEERVASFREPENVGRVVQGIRQEHPVLSASDGGGITN